MPVDTLSADVPVSYRMIPGFVEYLVGDDGSVWSCHKRFPKRLKPYVDKDGYHGVALFSRGRYTSKRVHRVVLEAFVGPCPDGMLTAHRNGIRSDNRLDNLRWDTQANNVQDKREHGTWQCGERHGNAILTEDAVRTIRSERYRTSCRDLAERFGVAEVTIYFVWARRLWAHVA